MVKAIKLADRFGHGLRGVFGLASSSERRPEQATDIEDQLTSSRIKLR